MNIQTNTAAQYINPADMVDSTRNGYSQAVIAPAGKRMAYISGQTANYHDGAITPDFDAQVLEAYANLAKVLDAMDARPDQVVKLTTYVVDHDPSKFPILVKAVVDMFGDARPAQSLVPVPCLAVPGLKFEVEAVVAID